jgi:hypothetical protein
MALYLQEDCQGAYGADVASGSKEPDRVLDLHQYAGSLAFTFSTAHR